MIEDDDAYVLPRKWFDSKQYVRIEPNTGQPQLIRVEPVIMGHGDMVPEQVLVTIDNEPSDIMDRSDCEDLIEALGCTPLEITAQWKHRKIN